MNNEEQTVIENALLKQALGYFYVEKTIDVDLNGKRRVLYEQKYMPPNVNACIKLLTKLNPEKWGNAMPTTNVETDALSKAFEEIERHEVK